MKKLILISLTLFTLMFISCEKENCRETALGTYVGTSTASGTSINLNVTVNAGNDEKDALVVFTPTSITSPEITLAGDFNLDCTVITILEQTISNSIISGSFSINGKILTGTLYSSGSPNMISCSK
jgi:hypothetical protein